MNIQKTSGNIKLEILVSQVYPVGQQGICMLRNYIIWEISFIQKVVQDFSRTESIALACEESVRSKEEGRGNGCQVGSMACAPYGNNICH